MQPILILGGYGNFGKRIAQSLVAHGLPIVIAGRDATKAASLTAQLGRLATAITCDVNTGLADILKQSQPCVVINTCGPFQIADYRVADICIQHAVHYIDLADGREFVTGIRQLDAAAKKQTVAVISGASTVPALSSAVIEHYAHEFSQMERLVFGISPGQQAERGLATTQGILSYVGKALKPFPNQGKNAYGWQNIHKQRYPEIGSRWMANCDIPDLDLLPAHYGFTSIQFSAGLEIGLLHLGLWGLSWLVRAGMPLDLSAYAAPLLKASNWFDRFGSADGGMHVIISGRDANGNPHKRAWFIIAFDGHGPHIPTIPAIILAKKLATNTLDYTGASACVGMVALDEYVAELKGLHIKTYD
jgi:Saccharopine dehydrogenase NADP binding domain